MTLHDLTNALVPYRSPRRTRKHDAYPLELVRRQAVVQLRLFSEQLRAAALAEDCERVAALLRDGVVGVDDRLFSGGLDTLLHVVVAASPDLLQDAPRDELGFTRPSPVLEALLLEHRASVNARTADGRTALHQAVGPPVGRAGSGGVPRMLKLLLRHTEGRTALYQLSGRAVPMRQLQWPCVTDDTLDALVEIGLDAVWRDVPARAYDAFWPSWTDDGSRALTWRRVFRQHVAGAMHAPRATALWGAVASHNLRALRSLIAAGADLELMACGHVTTPLHTACVIGDFDAAYDLVWAGADTRAFECTHPHVPPELPLFGSLRSPLCIAAYQHDDELCGLLQWCTFSNTFWHMELDERNAEKGRASRVKEERASHGVPQCLGRVTVGLPDGWPA